MKRIRKHRPSPATGIALAALIVALGGAAFAAIPGSDGTIHACYQQRSGNLRVVESTDACRSRERPLNWNQRGPTDEGSTKTFYGEVRTEESTGSTSYTDLATVGPTVRVTVPPNALINLRAQAELKSTDPTKPAQVTVFEAADFPNPDLTGFVAQSASTDHFELNPRISGAILLAATPGTRTYVLKYRATGGTATFRNRRLWITVFPASQLP
jgi:hypothetical protein